MTLPTGLRSPRQVVATFAVVAVVSSAALAFLSWRLLEQDRQLDEPRRRGLVEASADVVEARLQTALQALLPGTEGADKAASPAPAGAVFVTIEPGRTTVSPSGGLPFVPTREPLRQADPAVLAAGTAAEFAEPPDTARALGVYRALGASGDRAVRATALARLAALLARQGNRDAALETYAALDAFDDVAVGGLPGGLVAGAGRVSLLAAAGDETAARQAAETFGRDLARGRWPLTEAEFAYYVDKIAGGRHATSPADLDAAARAGAAAWLWDQRASLGPSGQRLVSLARGPAVIRWQQSDDRIDAGIGDPAFLDDQLRAALPPNMGGMLSDVEGTRVAGAAPPDHDVATRMATPGGLPGTLHVWADPSAQAPGDSTRRRLVLLVMAAVVMMVGGGWYFIARALTRELRVARLQHDFVSSVSHEFRTPLTSIAHLADLLATDRLPQDAQRRRAYTSIVDDTARLRDLVEHLLDFSRFEGGDVGLRRERADVGALVADVVEEARRRVATSGYTIEYEPPDDPLMADVDRAALSRAVWNLIDNSVKYSPDCHTVWVEVARTGSEITIAVRDQGLGIPAAEHESVFGRFVRGAESEARHIRGTGIGLAFVRQIVEAHGGRVTLDSAQGEGSTFSIVLSMVTPQESERPEQPERRERLGVGPEATPRRSERREEPERRERLGVGPQPH